MGRRKVIKAAQSSEAVLTSHGLPTGRLRVAMELRRWGSLGAEQLCTLPAGTEVSILSSAEGWAEVLYRGQPGFLPQEILEEI